MSVVGHEEWVVDDVSCRGHYEVPKAYAKAVKKDKGRVLDAVVEVTGWSRDNARRRLAGLPQLMGT